jgi:hypothetical protein
MTALFILAPLFLVVGVVVAVIGARRSQNRRDR